MCERCNQKKSTYVGENAEDGQLHPYLDILPIYRFTAVEAEISAERVRINIFVDFTSGIDPQLGTRIQNQFDRIDVNSILAPEIEEMLGEYADIIQRDMPGGDATIVSDYFSREAGRFEERYGMSFWKAVLLRVLADDVEYCSGGYQVMLKTVRPQLPPAPPLVA